MIPCALLLICAVILDRLIGDPPYTGHPVRLIGRSIQILESLFRARIPNAFLGGTVLTLLALAFWETLLFLAMEAAFLYKPLGVLFSLYLLYSCIALRDLATHVSHVTKELSKGNLQKSREALQKIVGRDTQVLDEKGVLKATIETVSEALVDGFLSPIFYFSVFSLIGYLFQMPCLYGLMGVLGYRIINTLDSMIGYKNERYFQFGKFAARLDDIVNFVPARLSLLFLFLSVWLLKLDVASAIKTTRRDRFCSASPNAGHPESFVAGALHITLGGPVHYPFGLVDKPEIGNGTTPLTIETVSQSLKIVTLAGYLSAALMALALLLTPFAINLPGL